MALFKRHFAKLHRNFYNNLNNFFGCLHVAFQFNFYYNYNVLSLSNKVSFNK